MARKVSGNRNTTTTTSESTKQNTAKKRTSSTFLHRALTDSFSSGVFIDTKIYGFSTRKSSGYVSDPRALYANSHVLRQIPHFDIRFLEGATTNIRENEEALDKVDCWYGYSSDSDLEEDYQESNDIEESTTDDTSSGYSLDPDTSERDQNFSTSDSFDFDSFPYSQLGDPLQISEIHYHPVTFNESTLHDVESKESNILESGRNQSSTQPIHLGKVVFIKDAAFTTLQALVLYLYTGEIEFAPFGSDENRLLRKSEDSMTEDEKFSKASPKSIFRLAEKYDIPELKNIAFNHIIANLSNCDIVEELFCRFTSYYPEIRNAEAKQLATLLADSEAAIDLLDKKIQSYAEGKLPHATEAFTVLFDVLSDKKIPQVDAPLVKSVVPSIKSTSPYWSTLKTALNKSLTTGTFLDLQVFARSSRRRPHTTARSLRPVYLSRTLVKPWFDKIEACTAKFDANTEEILINEGDTYYESDSDLDDDEESCLDIAGVTAAADSEEKSDTLEFTHHIPENPSSGDDGQDPVMFKIGAAATWKALLYYTYTNEVSFAPLSSGGREARAIGIQTRREEFPYQPRPCSPKSLYTLADKLCLDPLRNLAFEDIEHKLSATNIVTELFSKFTSSQQDILAMENKLLGEKFTNSESANMVKEHINTMSNGVASHQSNALKSVFRRIVIGGAVDLLCSSYCGNTHTTSSLRSGLYCPSASCSYYPYCGSCNNQRTSSTRTCLYCRARFKN